MLLCKKWHHKSKGKGDASPCCDWSRKTGKEGARESCSKKLIDRPADAQFRAEVAWSLCVSCPLDLYLRATDETNEKKQRRDGWRNDGVTLLWCLSPQRRVFLKVKMKCSGFYATTVFYSINRSQYETKRLGSRLDRHVCLSFFKQRAMLSRVHSLRQ